MMQQDILADLINALAVQYNGDRRGGVHVSDIILCPRKRVFRDLQPMPITMLELNFFTSGSAIHEAIQSLAKHYPDKYSIEHAIDFYGVKAHIDLYNKQENIPIEAKTRRVASAKAPKIAHVRQLEAYMAIVDATKGVILYQLLLHFGKQPFVVFNIERTPAQNEAMRSWLIAEKEYLKLALEQKNPSLARSVMFDKDFNFGCDNCPYLKPCQQINLIQQNNS